MKHRMTTLLTMFGSVALLTSVICAKPVALYVWNASESAPLGLYRLQPVDTLFVTELVAVMPPEPLATFLAEGSYLPRGVPMLKRVLAIPRANGLQARPHHYRRWSCSWRGARARQAGPSTPGLAGLPRHGAR